MGSIVHASSMTDIVKIQGSVRAREDNGHTENDEHFILNLHNSFYDFLHDISREFSTNSAGWLSNSAVIGSHFAILTRTNLLPGTVTTTKKSVCIKWRILKKFRFEFRVSFCLAQSGLCCSHKLVDKIVVFFPSKRVELAFITSAHRV